MKLLKLEATFGGYPHKKGSYRGIMILFTQKRLQKTLIS